MKLLHDNERQTISQILAEVYGMPEKRAYYESGHIVDLLRQRGVVLANASALSIATTIIDEVRDKGSKSELIEAFDLVLT